MHDCPRASSSLHPRKGFTLIELLVVIGIIVLLISILLPVVSHVRIAGNKADTQNWINQLGSAIERYQQDFKAYPGPLANNEMDLIDASPKTYANTSAFSGGLSFATGLPAGAYDTLAETPLQASGNLTMSENLVLGLLGGVRTLQTSAGPPAVYQLVYDPSAVGGGPVSLTTVGLPKRYPPYLDSKQLSWTTNSNGQTGHFQDDSGSANDTIIPTFVDRFTEPMPILYMRAKLGANAAPGTGGAGTFSNSYNSIVTNDFAETAMNLASPTPGPAPRAGQYDISQIIAYTGSYSGNWPSLALDSAVPPTGTSIGIGKSARASDYTVPPAGNNLYHGLQMFSWTAPSYPTLTKQSPNVHPYQYPYDAYPYLIGSSGTAREKDAYILISAGADRVYGTEDDICNFGDVNP